MKQGKHGQTIRHPAKSNNMKRQHEANLRGDFISAPTRNNNGSGNS